MKRVYKYNIGSYGTTELIIPEDAEALKVGIQDNHIALWMLVEDTNPNEDRRIKSIATGEIITIGLTSEEYIGTIILKDGYVAHIFDVTFIEA